MPELSLTETIEVSRAQVREARETIKDLKRALGDAQKAIEGIEEKLSDHLHKNMTNALDAAVAANKQELDRRFAKARDEAINRVEANIMAMYTISAAVLEMLARIHEHYAKADNIIGANERISEVVERIAALRVVERKE